MININYIDKFGGRDFEIFTSNLLRVLGYHSIKLTPATGDHGLDVIAKNSSNKSIGVQCKHLNKGEHTGYRAIEEAFTGKAYYNLDKSVVLTNQYLTKNALRSAKKPAINVKCLDRDNLKTLISIANNIIIAQNSHEKAIQNRHPRKSYETVKNLIFHNDYSLREFKLINMLSNKIVKTHYSHSIKLNFKYLKHSLDLSNKDLNKGALIYIFEHTDNFAFHSTILGGRTGSINLFCVQPLDNDGYYTFFISNSFINMLKGNRVFD